MKFRHKECFRTVQPMLFGSLVTISPLSLNSTGAVSSQLSRSKCYEEVANIYKDVVRVGCVTRLVG